MGQFLAVELSRLYVDSGAPIVGFASLTVLEYGGEIALG
jgi:hypothetical protein